MRTWLALVGALVGATVTVLVLSTVPSAALESAPPGDPGLAAQLAQAHRVAAAVRATLTRQDTRATVHRRAVHRRQLARAQARQQQREQRWVAPVRGSRLSAGFGESGALWDSGSHTGQDLVVPYGTTVRAAHAGTVTFAGWGDRYGNLVEITHAGGVQSWYAHLSQVWVRVGEQVATGSPIGATGCTGNCYGTHLHLEVRLGHDVPVDPMVWLRLRGVRL